MKKGYYDNLEKATLENKNFRNAVYTGQHMQLVLMTLQPGEDIGEEVHPDGDQFFRFESGKGEVVVGSERYLVGPDDSVIVPAGENHNVTNTSDTDLLQFYTIYAPPHHAAGTVRASKAEAEADHPEFDGTATE